jgi:hypothetical protein
VRLTCRAGLIIGVSVLVAAGIAVYESPQFQQWVINSRRKIALALHNLGDEIQPREIPLREDISMTEEAGEVAEERRRIARAEIMRRSTLMESRRKSNHPSPAEDGFDTLVDKDGNLRKQKDHGDGSQSPQIFTAESTGLDLGIFKPVRRGGNPIEAESSATLGSDPLHIGIPSSASSIRRYSQSSNQHTPTSDGPEENDFFDPFAPNSPLFSSDSSHTEEDQHVYYAHPDASANMTHHNDLFNESAGFGHGSLPSHHDVSAAPSTSGSFSHVGGSDDGTSDGTLSDLGARSIGGVTTPGSWSEVGSVVSDADASHVQLL